MRSEPVQQVANTHLSHDPLPQQSIPVQGRNLKFYDLDSVPQNTETEQISSIASSQEQSSESIEAASTTDVKLQETEQLSISSSLEHSIEVPESFIASAIVSSELPLSEPSVETKLPESVSESSFETTEMSKVFEPQKLNSIPSPVVVTEASTPPLSKSMHKATTPYIVSHTDLPDPIDFQDQEYKIPGNSFIFIFLESLVLNHPKPSVM